MPGHRDTDVDPATGCSSRGSRRSAPPSSTCRPGHYHAHWDDDKKRQQLLESVRKGGKVVQLPATMAELSGIDLAALLDGFEGVPFVVATRSLSTTAQASPALVSVAPAVDGELEQRPWSGNASSRTGSGRDHDHHQGRDGYRRLFDARKSRQRFDDERVKTGDQHAGQYVYDEDEGNRIELAVNVALAAERPLLVRGVPGTGKSSLAADVARRLGWRYYEVVVSSRTQARDLQWTFDAVERLSDAQVAGTAGTDARRRLRDDAAYVRPGALWWAFDRESASRRGLTDDELREQGLRRERDPEAPREEPAGGGARRRDRQGRPDVPNDLLVPLGSFRFEVDRLKSQDKPVQVVAARAPLVIITTNEERDLPQAFLRRCVTLRLEPPKDPRLEADRHGSLPRPTHRRRAGPGGGEVPRHPGPAARQGRPRGQHRRVPRRRRRLHRPQDRARRDRALGPARGAGARQARQPQPRLMSSDPPAPLATFVRALLTLQPDRATTTDILEVLNLAGRAPRPPEERAASDPAPPPHCAGSRSHVGAPSTSHTPRRRGWRQVDWCPRHGTALRGGGARPPDRQPRRPPPRPFRPLATLLADPVAAPSEPEDLFPAGQRRALLGGLCASRRLEGDLDVEAVTERIGQGEVVATIPRRPVLTTRYGIELLVDVGEGMRPFGADVARVRTAIERIVGRDNLDVQQFAGCPLEDPGAGRGPHWTWERYNPAASARPALALSDLGLGGRPPGRPDLAPRWSELADQLRARAAGSSCSSPTRRSAGRRPSPVRLPSSPGTVAPMSATSSGPCGAGKGADARRGGGADRSVGQQEPGCRPAGPGRLAGRPRGARPAPPGPVARQRRRRRRERPVVERAGGHAELERARARASVADALRARLAAPDERDLRREAWQLLRACHAGKPDSIKLEELLNWHTVSGEFDAKARIEELLQAAAQEYLVGASEPTGGVRWILGALRRLPRMAVETPTAAALGAAAAVTLDRSLPELGDVSLPPDVVENWFPGCCRGSSAACRRSRSRSSCSTTRWSSAATPGRPSSCGCRRPTRWC